MTVTFDLAVFALGCVFFLQWIARRLIWGNQNRLRAERHGGRGVMLRDALVAPVPLSLYMLAFLRADLGWPWLVPFVILALMTAGILAMATLGRRALAERDAAMAGEQGSPERAAMIAIQKKQGRLAAILPALLLVLWIVSWRSVLGST